MSGNFLFAENNFIHNSQAKHWLIMKNRKLTPSNNV
jgi:hypothetical protein